MFSIKDQILVLMVENQPRRTLNRIYTAICGSVAKTTNRVLDTCNLSRQLLEPSKQSAEQQTVTLDDKSYCVMEKCLCVDLIPQTICAETVDVAISKANAETVLTDQPPIREAMDSADCTKQGVASPNLWPSSISFTDPAVAKVEFTHDCLAHIITGNGKHSLTSLSLAYKLDSVADRTAFVINNRPSAHSNEPDTDTTCIRQVKTSNFKPVKASRLTTDLRLAEIADIDIKIHVSTPIVLINQLYSHNTRLSGLNRWGKGNAVANPIPPDRHIPEAHASNSVNMCRDDIKRNASIPIVYEKLVERIYDG